MNTLYDTIVVIHINVSVVLQAELVSLYILHCNWNCGVVVSFKLEAKGDLLQRFLLGGG